jgi:rubrerythrin
LGGVKGTVENLGDAIEGEGFEFKEMYPKFIKEAEAEGNGPATWSFNNANAVEEIHHGLYTDALNAVKAGNDLPASTIYVCSVCGNTVLGDAQDVCSVCKNPKEKFFEVK